VKVFKQRFVRHFVTVGSAGGEENLEDLKEVLKVVMVQLFLNRASHWLPAEGTVGLGRHFGLFQTKKDKSVKKTRIVGTEKKKE